MCVHSMCRCEGEPKGVICTVWHAAPTCRNTVHKMHESSPYGDGHLCFDFLKAARGPLTMTYPSTEPNSAVSEATAATEIVESPHVATAEACAVDPSRVSAIEAVARLRLLTVGMNTLLVEVAALLSNAQISVVVVCDAAGLPMGIITETILVRHLGLGQADFFTTHAADVMTHDITSCAPDDSLAEVLAMMHARSIIHVLVVDAANKPLGVLNARDGLRALLAAGNHEGALLRNYVAGVGYQ